MQNQQESLRKICRFIFKKTFWSNGIDDGVLVTFKQLNRFELMLYNVYPQVKKSDVASSKILLELFIKIRTAKDFMEMNEDEIAVDIIVDRSEVLSAVAQIKLIKKIYKI